MEQKSEEITARTTLKPMKVRKAQDSRNPVNIKLGK